MDVDRAMHSPLVDKGRRRRMRLTLIAGAVALLCLVAAGPALAAPSLQIFSLADTTVAPNGTLGYHLHIRNVGNVPTNAPADPTCDPNTPPVDPDCIVLTATLPAGMTATGIRNVFPAAFNNAFCTGLGVPGPATVTCATATSLQTRGTAPNSVLPTLDTTVDPSASGVLTTSFTISGGGSPSASTVDPTQVALAPPPFGVDVFDGQVSNAAGDAFTQAGGHPYSVSASIDFNTLENPNPVKGTVWPVEPVKDVLVDLPPGFVGNPTSLDQCTTPQLAHPGFPPECSPASQVGTALLFVNGFGQFPNAVGPIPVYNMVPPPDVPARFAFYVVGTIVTLDAQLRSGSDYGLTIDARDAPEGLDLAGTSLTFWGVPADPSHNLERACPSLDPPYQSGVFCTAGTSPKAFLRNPTSCTEPLHGLTTSLHVDSWFNPGRFNADGFPDLADPNWRSASFESHLPPAYPSPRSAWGAAQGPTGCAKVPFDPTLVATPGSPIKPSSPTALSVDLSLPQNDDPAGIGEGDLKKAVVTLPAGLRVSPSSASGLDACTPAQVGLHSQADAMCPEESRIGSVVIDTPLLKAPLRGSVFLAKPRDNPFGTLLSLYIVARGPGLVIKLSGRIDPDPVTGQLSTTFDDNPQTPFSNLHLEFKDGPRAPLVTPRQCGTYTTKAELTSWSGKVVEADSSFTVSDDGKGGACPAPQFSPDFTAGTETPVAGGRSPFHLRISRDDQDEELGSVTVDMPNGLTGKIATADLCSERDAKAGSCPAGSKVGSVTVGAGAGSDPFYITNGRAYITGAYRGAPFGLSIVVPAVAGPFDLGNVVVRSAIYVDKHTSELRIVSDPLPRILEGIPLDVRDVRVSVDKPGFIVNPTSCAEKTIGGSIESVDGKTAKVSSRFQVGECANLSLKPKMVLGIGSRGHTSRGASAPFSTTLTMPSSGQANLRSVRVTLPTTINARLPVINKACTRAAFESNRCAGARAGTAVAKTPLLRDPLRGEVFFVRNGHPLPDLFVALRGQVSFDLIGKVSIPGSKSLATTFDAVPDVPISSFTLKLVSGKQGPVGAAANLCSTRGRNAEAKLDYVGQNGRVLHVDQRLVIHGCAKHKSGRRSHHGGK